MTATSTASPPVLHAAPAAGFDEPFEMLHACHERVQRMLGLLGRLQQHLAQHGADLQARQAARDLLRYFDHAAVAHHEDEERHIVPALLVLGRTALAERLLADHATMAHEWARLRLPLHGLAEQGSPPSPPLDSAAFAALYREHIELEEGEAFPAAATTLDEARRAAMGREMAQRRGVRGG